MTTLNGSVVINGTQTAQSPAFWAGSLACAVAWFLASGKRDELIRTYRDYLKRGASADVRAHLDAIWKGK